MRALHSAMAQETGHTDTDDAEVFRKRFAYTCAHTYARKSLEFTVSSVSVLLWKLSSVFIVKSKINEELFGR